MRFVALSLATALGVGYVPFAPGTIGSLAGLLVWFLLPSSPLVHAAVVLGLFVFGSWSASVAEQHFASTDPAPVVIDEVMGMLIALFMAPVGWPGAIAGFLWFRGLDVVKPYPADRFEQLHGGVGVMADDAMAGVYANLALRVTLAIAASLGYSSR